MEKEKNAVISISDKQGLEKVGQFLLSNNYRIFGTSGTKNYLEENGVNCESVEKLTGNPEILGGRVKTLSTSLLAGILSKDREDEDLKKFSYKAVDLVLL